MEQNMKFIKKVLGILKKEEMMKKADGETDVGKVREANEDYFLVNPDKRLYIVSDGMGGHNAGEVASMNATESVNNYFSTELLSEMRGDDEKIKNVMINALLNAHKEITDMAKSNATYTGMGCTLVVAWIDGDVLHLCHVGDSRAYMCNNSGIQLLTTDHSYVMSLVAESKMTMEEARVSPLKNELSQAIGASIEIEPDYNRYSIKNGDKILLCSDGLWDMLSDEEIYEILRNTTPVTTICQELIHKANQAGGHDNVTAVVIRHEDN
jgi:protein phosphatase